MVVRHHNLVPVSMEHAPETQDGKDRWQGASRRWVSFLFLTIGFFLLYHDLFRVSRPQGTSSASALEIADATAAGSSLRRIVLCTFAAFGGLALAWPHPISVRLNGGLGRCCVLFLLWSALSVVWAGDVSFTARRVAILLFLSLAALGVARRFSPDDLLRLAFFGSAVFLAVGVLAEILWGDVSLSLVGYRFSGTLHPNHQAWNCATLLFSSLVLATTSQRGRSLFYASALLAFVFLLLTRSRTGFGAAVFVLLAFFLARAGWRAALFGALVATSVLSLLSLTMRGELPELLSQMILLGRTDSQEATTLTGRVPLWAELVPYIVDKPFFGYGYDGFWTPERQLEISRRIGWPAPGGHSGFLDMTLGVGLPGALCYTGMLTLALYGLWKWYSTSYKAVLLFGAMMILFQLVVMLTEEMATTVCMPSFLVLATIVQVGLTDWSTGATARSQ